MKNLLFAVVVGALSISNASACSCRFQTLDQNVAQADQIFIATLESARVVPGDYPNKWPSTEGRFRLRKSLKGAAPPPEMVLTSGMGRSDCGVYMTVSYKYVIFKGKGSSAIGGCDATSAIEDFQEEEIVAKIQSILHPSKRQSGKR